jgi:hypothetical protein
MCLVLVEGHMQEAKKHSNLSAARELAARINIGIVPCAATQYWWI